MARVTTCPYCQRTVGLMTDRPTPNSYPRSPRMALHAAEDADRSRAAGRRPKCVQGSGLEVDPAAIRDEAGDRPSRRSRTKAPA